MIWVTRLPCGICGDGPCENHHVRSDGVSRKGPYRVIVPLCDGCHSRLHRIGKLSMLQWVNREYGGLLWNGQRAEMQWDDLAARVEAAWQELTLDGAVRPTKKLTDYLNEQG